ncbi:MAG: CHASE2 domain-containing protein [Spirochaetes bacterium]|nr:MAG: CHASE2 domain-containing protein [Spirochaetota bacterium]
MIKNFIAQFKENLKQNKYYAVGVSVVLVLFILLLSLTTIYELFELKLYDLRFRVKPAPAQWEMLTFLDIDDNAIKIGGQFPWPRYIYADGVNVLHKAGLRQAAFDVQFMDDSPRIARKDEFSAMIERARAGGRMTVEDVEKAVIDNDKLLAAALKQSGSVVLSYSFLNEKISMDHLDRKTRQEYDAAYRIFTEKASIPVPKERVGEFQSLVSPDRVMIQFPIPALTRQARTFGYVDSDFDMDGISRKIRLVRVFENRVYFHMALAMLIDQCGIKPDDVRITPGSRIVLPNAVNPVTLEKKDIVIPIDAKGMMFINWAGQFATTFHHLSFSALLEYGNFRDSVYAFLNDEGDDFLREQKMTRKSIVAELPKRIADYAAAKDPAQRADKWKTLAATRDKLRSVDVAIFKGIQDEAATSAEKLKSAPKRDLQEYVTNLQNLSAAFKLVSEVDQLRDKTGIIGLTATATQDMGVTPVSSEYPMVGTYHNIFNTIVQNNYIHKAHPLINILIMLAIALAAGLLIQRLSAMQIIVAIIAGFIGVTVVSVLVFALADVWLDQLGITLSLLLPSVAIGAIKFASEESQKRFIKSAFSNYLSPLVIDEIIKNPESLQLGGELREISIFFSDVAGFSTISEKLNPQQLVALLNEYLSEMTDIILGYGGTVDKYEGDAIIAFFGAPHPFPDHAQRLCFAAIDMKKRLAELRDEWRKTGRDELKVRMGMNTGNAVVGNMGSKMRMDYTMMGDAVNLAARLEGVNKKYGTYAMIAENTYEQAKDVIEARELDIIRVVGKEEPTKVYELLGRKGSLPDYMHEMLEKYYEGLAAWREREWKAARSAFRSALKIVENDGASKTYYDRCTEFIENPPPKSWDGVYRLTTK